MTPTAEQKSIIDASGNIVVVAKPGSGKTFVLSEKIREILPLMEDYQGVIAISFTNKASSELRNRALTGGFDKKESFFGTIHKFYIAEIVLSFGKQVFGLPGNEIEIVDWRQLVLDGEEINYLESLEQNFDCTNEDHVDSLGDWFRSGKVYLSLVEKYAIYIYDNSLACRKYLKSKYKYVIIDEFQDCGKEQYDIFMRLKDLGLIAIAVGDLDQSIYEFAGKSPRFLSALIGDANFKTFPLTRNHRCHPSIINYSLSLMSDDVALIETDSKRIYQKQISGNEIQVSQWIDRNISKICDRFGVTSLSEVAILTKVYRTANIVDGALAAPHRIIKASSLEMDNNPISELFGNILKFAYSKKFTITEIVEKFTSLSILGRSDQKELRKNFETIKSILSSSEDNFPEVKISCEKIAKILIPNRSQEASLCLLEKVLNEELEIYSKISENEIQIITLHKSKGLEFDIVFHLDLYEWVLPAKGIRGGQQVFYNWGQDLNLHYVGITRAKKACFLCCSTKRTNNQGETKNGNLSEFLTKPSLLNLKKIF